MRSSILDRVITGLPFPFNMMAGSLIPDQARKTLDQLLTDTAIDLAKQTEEGDRSACDRLRSVINAAGYDLKEYETNHDQPGQ